MFQQKLIKKSNIFFILFIILILSHLKFPFNRLKLPSNKILRTIFALLFVHKFQLLRFLLNFFQNLSLKLLSHVPHSHFPENLYGLFLRLLVAKLNFVQSRRQFWVQNFFQSFFVNFECALSCFVTLVFANVAPSVLDVRNCSFVYRGYVVVH